MTEKCWATEINFDLAVICKWWTKCKCVVDISQLSVPMRDMCSEVMKTSHWHLTCVGHEFAHNMLPQCGACVDS